MGNKIRPDSFRLGITTWWNAHWFAKKNFRFQLEEDILIRKIINNKISSAGITRVDIERNANNNYRVTIKAARPGFIIGRGGQGIESLNKDLESALHKLWSKQKSNKPTFSLSLNIEELKRSEVSAVNVAQNIAMDLEKRMPSRRTVKKYIDFMMQNRDVQGAKIKLSGRLDGSEIARREWLAKGKLPLQTLRANIDYGEATAFNTYGTVGIKVWINKGEILN